MANTTSRTVIYRQPLPPVTQSRGIARGAWEGVHIIRLIAAFGVGGGIAIYAMGWAVAVGLALLIVVGIALWRFLGDGKETFYPDFAAIQGDDLEVAGRRINGNGPAKRIPLGEITGWDAYRKGDDAFGEVMGLEFAHGKHTYRLGIDNADLFEMGPLEAIAPTAVARIRKGT